MDFKEVCCNIRSCLNSSKSQLSLTQLNRDYHEVLGENIPYRSLGYQSLEALIRTVPNIRINSIRGELFIDVKPDEKTAHIASLVREQRAGKKKKRKSSRGGFYRGNVAPPRRPATMPPRRSGPPPSYQSDYKRNLPSDYNSGRRRDSPPEQSYQNQRRQNPPRQSDSQYSRRRDSPPPPASDNYYSRRRDSPPPPASNNYYSRRRDSPPPPASDNNYSRRRDPSPPPKSSYSNHRNSAVIEISSDEENRIEQITRKYRSHPSQYDFSDPNELDDDVGSDFDDCEEINNQMEELKVTLGKQRQVSINKPKYRSYPSNTSNDDDYGYSSMKTTHERGNERGYSRRPYYQTPSSDSYDHDDEDDYDYDYTSSSTTNTDKFDSTDTNGYTSTGSTQTNIRRPFGRANVLPNAYDGEEYPRSGSRGRGHYLEERLRKSTTSESSMCSTLVSQGNIKLTVPNGSGGNIKVTVPNGSGRARVVNFLLR